MYKPKEYPVPGKDYFAWEYEPQTMMKHAVLREYYKVWATKLGKYQTAHFFDCFGGCGAYIDIETDEIALGSPFQISKIASELSDRKLRVYVSEKDKKYYENLLKVREDVNGDTVIPKIANKTFEEVLQYKWTKRVYQKEPTFFFIDPFGFSVKMDDFLGIMNYEKNEMIINFMFDHINRFLEVGSIERRNTEFFGTNEWKNITSLHGTERENALVDLYRRQLKRVAKYVFPYRLSFPDRDRTYYYLFHVTNNKEGCSIMKSAFASQNYGRVEYLGNRNDVMSIYDLQNMKEGDIRQLLVENYRGQSIAYDDLIDDIIDAVPYLEKDIRSTLKEMRKDGSVMIERVSSKTDNGLRGKDIIVFTREQQLEIVF